jgi:hypothetical protein
VSNLSKVLKGAAVLGVAGVLGTLIGWLASRQGDVTPVVVPAPAASQSLALAQLAPSTTASNPYAPIIIHEPVHTDVSAGTVDEGFPPWEHKLDDILLGDDDENGKADKILALIPTAPPEAQQELAQHLVNMVQDDHYDGTAELLTNANTPADVSGVLMNDLLNRNNSLKLPMLLAIARTDNHPLKDQALDLLGLLTQEDDGTNWDQWSATIDTWLQDNPQ